jgi:DNA-binding MarR family transcriptional regulator
MLLPHEETVIVALRKITQAIDTHSRYLLLEFGLTAPQIASLRLVSTQGETTPGKMADELHLSPQTIAGILNRLEQRGLLCRVKDERDRRSIRIRITQEGQEALKKAPPLLRDQFRKEFAKLQTWEQTQILATLQRVAAMMKISDLEVEPFLETQPAASPSAVAQCL